MRGLDHRGGLPRTEYLQHETLASPSPKTSSIRFQIRISRRAKYQAPLSLHIKRLIVVVLVTAGKHPRGTPPATSATFTYEESQETHQALPLITRYFLFQGRSHLTTNKSNRRLNKVPEFANVSRGLTQFRLPTPVYLFKVRVLRCCAADLFRSLRSGRIIKNGSSSPLNC